MNQPDLEDLYERLYAVAVYLLKCRYHWFRGNNTDSFLKGKQAHDYVMDAMEKYMVNPSIYDPNSKRSLFSFLKLDILRTLIGNDARSPENRTSISYSDLSGITDDDDESINFEEFLPGVIPQIQNRIDYEAVMQSLEAEAKGDSHVEQILLGFRFELKRREIIDEFKMTEKEHDNAMGRLDTIRNRVIDKLRMEKDHG